MHNDKIFQVSEFNAFVNVYLGEIREVVIEGEISQCRVSQNKWLFITIKDKESSVEVFGLVFQIHGYDLLEEGMLVHVYGVPRLYQKTGRFSIFASQIIPAGKGALIRAFDKLKAKLASEGLFALERKRSLPTFPERIGLITAEGSRAYSDFVTVLGNRMGGITLYFYPVSVQGSEAVSLILSALRYFNIHHADFDILVITRGGGSLEDLQAFNDERIARAIFSSKIPVVSAVGHEDDVSIADLVADARASTPSNAAEIIVRHRKEVWMQISFLVKTMERMLSQELIAKNHTITTNVQTFHDMIQNKMVDMKSSIVLFHRHFVQFAAKQEQFRIKTDVAYQRLVQSVNMWIRQQKQQISGMVRLLEHLNYHALLARGFSMTIDVYGRIVRSVDVVQRGERITTVLSDGTIDSKVITVRNERL